MRGVTGAQVARSLLDSNGLQQVKVERAKGFLSDHYDPRAKVLRLSPAVHDSPSIAAAGIAAHEMGHALQDARNYAPLGLRSVMVPSVRLGSWMGADPVLYWIPGQHHRTSLVWPGPLCRHGRICSGHTARRVRRQPQSQATSRQPRRSGQPGDGWSEQGSECSGPDLCSRRPPGHQHAPLLWVSPDGEARLTSRVPGSEFWVEPRPDTLRSDPNRCQEVSCQGVSPRLWDSEINTIGRHAFSPSDSPTRPPMPEPLPRVREQPSVLGNLFRFFSLFRIRRQVPDGQKWD